MHTAQLDPRIGTLANGQFYAFAHGYDQPETVGTLQQVERALGIAVKPDAKPSKTFDQVRDKPRPSGRGRIALAALAAMARRADV